MTTTRCTSRPHFPPTTWCSTETRYHGLRVRSLHWENHPYGHHDGDLEDDGRRCWLLLTDLADERTLRITITGQDMHVDQRLEDPPRNG